MAKRRRSSKRSKSSKRRKTSSSRRRPRGGRRQGVHYYKRIAYSTAFHTQAGGAPAIGRALRFQLNFVPSHTEFTSLYDQYQIKAVKAQLIPKHTMTDQGIAEQGNMWSCIDYDDVTVPTSLNTILQYQNARRSRMHRTHKRYLKPMIATEIFNTGLTTAYAPKRNVWIDAAIDTVEHYGLKFWFDSVPQTVTYDLMVTYYLAFKNVR